jgi:hypothetical protein
MTHDRPRLQTSSNKPALNDIVGRRGHPPDGFGRGIQTLASGSWQTGGCVRTRINHTLIRPATRARRMVVNGVLPALTEPTNGPEQSR